MNNEQHPEYEFEKKRLEHTQKAIDKYSGKSQANKSAGVDAWSRVSLQKHNFRVSEDYKRQRHSPYFIRVDFVELGSDLPEQWYIGYRALNLGEYEVYDWRAPVGKLAAGSSAERQAFARTQGRLLLRRRFEINHVLEKISDEFDRRKNVSQEDKQVEFISNEQYLLEQLYTRGDPRLQDIVKSIQEKQDKIIRARHDQVVIINGVAGSGKTSVAIHRLAYLLYPGNENKINASRTIIFCPNPIFLHYIEDLLPSLGEKDVKQTTFAAWAIEKMRRQDLQVVDSSQDMFLSPNQNRDILKQCWNRARRKGSLKFKQLMDRYVTHLQQKRSYSAQDLSYLQQGELQLDFIFYAQEIVGILDRNFEKSSTTLSSTRESAWADLRNLIKKKYEDAVWKKSDELKARSEEQAIILENILPDVENEDEQNNLREEIKILRKKHEDFRDFAFRTSRVSTPHYYLVESALKKDFDNLWPPIDALGLYQELFGNKALLSNLCQGLFTQEDVDTFASSRFAPSNIEMEDLAGVMYFHQRIMGGDNTKYDHIVIDEAQDFSPLQILLIYEKSIANSLTLVGDTAQGIHAHRGISKWEELLPIFPEKNISQYVVEQSYRSTVEIVELGNVVLRKLIINKPVLAVPLNRHGTHPKINKVNDFSKLNAELVTLVKLLISRKQKSIAVITKTVQDAKHLITLLESYGVNLEVSRSQIDGEFKYKGGLVVLPVTLTKGLEFESVIIYDASDEQYQTSYDGRLLYVAITRALHELYILYTDKISDFLSDVVSP